MIEKKYTYYFGKERKSNQRILQDFFCVFFVYNWHPRRSDLSISPSEPSIYDILAMPFKVLLGKALFLSTYPSHVIDTIKLMSKADSDSYVEQESYMNMFN